MATTYRAWVATKKGLPAVSLELKNDLVLPTRIPKGHVVVQVEAAALNPYIYKMTAGLSDFADGRPHIAERDFAGTVADPNDTSFVKGDKVFGFLPKATATVGALAEFLVIPASLVVKQPPGITSVEAAGLGIVVLTAHSALKALKVQRGDTVLINGGSSAVGLSAIQVAKNHMGLKVVATASAKNRAVLLDLGVDEFIDYTTAPLHEQLISRARTSPKFNGLFDAVGLTETALYLNCTRYLAPGAHYISAGGFPTSRKALMGMLRLILESSLHPVWLGGIPHKFSIATCPQDRKSLEEVRELVVQGSLKPIVDSVYSFDRTGLMAAYDKLMTSRAVGKVVIQVQRI
uniref:Quinone oxidoreductase n=1 Tax=Mycena chlorophos TaxID=658473 RepID=A0ABQ0LFF2_MYCCL|nr:quinone oxidoreductase [Mycena chlorophos]